MPGELRLEIIPTGWPLLGRVVVRRRIGRGKGTVMKERGGDLKNEFVLLIGRFLVNLFFLIGLGLRVRRAR